MIIKCWQFDLSSSSFSKSSLVIWEFLIHIMLSPSMQKFKHTWLACEMNAIVWCLAHSLVLPFLWIGMRTDLFQSCGHCWVFQICWPIECDTLMVSSFRVLNSSTRIRPSRCWREQEEMERIHGRTVLKISRWLQWCGQPPRTRHSGEQSEVGFRKHSY